MATARYAFPDGFLWGAATASYQIEGAVNEDGRAPSIWDTFSHTPNKIDQNHTGDVACDHYHRWQEDIGLMQDLNLQAYRFSIAWSRILPQGRGAINQAGLDFYGRLIDGLLAANITPFVTLYHWDLPQALQDEGGWFRRGVTDDFVEYTDVVTRALGDRVRHWITLNEPWVFAWAGHYLGTDAPGHQGTITDALQVSHHALLAHGKAIRVIRANVRDVEAGITLDMNMAEPASDRPEDIAAAERFNGFQNWWYADLIFRGEYPEDMLEVYDGLLPKMEAGDTKIMAAPIDFFGINFYRRSVMRHGDEYAPVNVERVNPPESTYTEMGWEVSPNGLIDILKTVHDRYQPPAMYVTENGAAFADTLGTDGKVHDPERASYLHEHFKAAHHAIQAGVPLNGYFVWTLMDNFEWAEGYSKRFGITYVDYETQKRIIKDSGYYLRDVARDNCLTEA